MYYKQEFHIYGSKDTALSQKRLTDRQRRPNKTVPLATLRNITLNKKEVILFSTRTFTSLNPLYIGLYIFYFMTTFGRKSEMKAF